MISNNSSLHSNDISAAELNSRLQNGEKLIVLDVREVIEYHTFNIGGKNIPLPQLTARLNELTEQKQHELIVVCKIGLRSETAAAILCKNGFNFVRNLSGGLMALQRLNY